MVESSIKSKKYDSSDAIRILNGKQAAYYWGNGCPPLDVYISKNFETNEPVIVYIFSRKMTQDTKVYDNWCNRKPKE